MQRIPEPELMDELDQAEAYARADFAEPNARFVESFDDLFPDIELRGAVADLGCGPADVSVRFALRHPHVTLDAIDGAEAMLAWGRRAVAEAGLSHRVHLHQRLLPATLPRSPYDAVISNSLLHHLPEGVGLWRTIASAARPGAPVLVMDLFRPDSPEAAARIVDAYAATEPEVLRRDFFASLCASFTLDEVRAQLAEAGLAHLTVAASSDRHLLVWGRR